MVKCSNISNGASLWNSPWIEIWRWCYPGGGGKNSPLPPSLAPCKRRWIVDWRFPPYPGDEGSLWNDELKRVDLFLPLWKQFLLIFICLVHLPYCLHHSIWDGGGQLQLALRDAWQWQWGHAIDAKEDGWTGAALNSLCVCSHERGPPMSVSGFDSFL